MPGDYGNQAYWDERYAADTNQYDWYQSYSDGPLREALGHYLGGVQQDNEILIVGCGNSTLAAELYTDGYTNITNIDSSEVVISQMHNIYADKEHMEFTVMDARNMEYIPDACFDAIIDKVRKLM